MKKYILLLVLFLFTNITHAQNKIDLTLIDIDKIGYNNLEELKNHSKVEWWVEMGERLLVSFNNNTTKPLPAFVKIITTKNNVDLSTLAFQSSGHCDHSSNNKDSHPNLEKLFGNNQFNLVSISKTSNKKEIFNHKQILPFEKNKVLVYQYENRYHEKLLANADIESLLSQVDKDRWFSQVEYLASLNRMLDSEIVIAGEWLENKFQDLGLITSRIDLRDIRDRKGFNVLGFKQGTTRPDDWYVVGAHLDSRNQQFNFTQPSPGAEDNASGCSGVLEMANVISQYDTEASIMFICFNAEEVGLIGSQDVVAVFKGNGDLNKVKTMFNMDMISYRLGTKNIAVAGTNSTFYAYLATAVANNGNLYTDIDWQISLNKCCTDFMSFSNVDIPSVSSHQPDISTYFGYHSINDLPENLDRELGSGIVKANLATLADLVGVDYSSANTFIIKPAHTGLWYNPDQSGHGLNIEVLDDNRILAFWYVYNDVGNQIWLLGTGTYEGNTASLEVFITESGVFPPNFVAQDVVNTSWGSFQFEFNDCNTGMFNWTPVDGNGFTAGSLELTRLTKIAGLNCE
jgi:hypothetical protein